MTLLLVAANL